MRTLILPAAVTLLTVAAMLYQAASPETRVCEPPVVRLGEIDGWESEAVPVSDAELTGLPKDTAFVKRRYSDGKGRWFGVTAVIGGKTKASLHRPELCLPSQGFQMTAPRDVVVDGTPWHCITLARRDQSSMGFAYTFFNQEGFRTASHLRRIFRDVWDRSVLNRVDRWVMVTVHASHDDAQAVCGFLRRLKGAME